MFRYIGVEGYIWIYSRHPPNRKPIFFAYPLDYLKFFLQLFQLLPSVVGALLPSPLVCSCCCSPSLSLSANLPPILPPSPTYTPHKQREGALNPTPTPTKPKQNHPKAVNFGAPKILILRHL